MTQSQLQERHIKSIGSQLLYEEIDNMIAYYKNFIYNFLNCFRRLILKSRYTILFLEILLLISQSLYGNGLNENSDDMGRIEYYIEQQKVYVKMILFDKSNEYGESYLNLLYKRCSTELKVINRIVLRVQTGNYDKSKYLLDKDKSVLEYLSDIYIYDLETLARLRKIAIFSNDSYLIQIVTQAEQPLNSIYENLLYAKQIIYSVDR